MKYKLALEAIEDPKGTTGWVETPGGMHEWATTVSALGLALLSRTLKDNPGSARFQFMQGSTARSVTVHPRPSRRELARIARRYVKEQLAKEAKK